MLLHPRRAAMLKRACAIAAAAVIPALAGCEAGNNAPVLQWHPPTTGTNKTVATAGANGYLAIRNAFLLGAPPTTTLPAGSSTGMFLALVNTGPRDRLVGVSAPGTATSVTLPAGGVSLPRDQTALLTGPVPKVILNSITRSLGGGSYVRMVLTFRNAGAVTMNVPVLPKASYNATYSPAPTPTPTPTAKHRHHGRAGATASPGATPTASATATP